MDNYPCEKVTVVQEFGNLCRIVYQDGSKVLYPRAKIHIEDKCPITIEIKYFQKIAEFQDMGKNDPVTSFLRKQYENLNYINLKSVLHSYLNSIPPVSLLCDELLIYPFYFNLSQKQATENAFRYNISIIEGPPGTGKTQTILNIIANSVMKNKTVAVVSNNNSAIANVQEKLSEEHYDFFTALLGKDDNKKEFFTNQPSYPSDMKAWQCTDEERSTLISKIKQLQSDMLNLLELQNRQARLKQERLALVKEKEYFDKYYKNSDFERIGKLSFYKLSDEKIISFLVDNYMLMSNNKALKIIKSFKLLFKYGFYNFKQLNERNNDIVLRFQKMYYEAKINSLDDEIQRIEMKLMNKDFEQMKKDCFEKSKILFRAKLFEKYKENLYKRPIFAKNTYTKDFPQFIKEYPIILSTTHALRSSIPQNFMFDYLIIDEASQVDLVTAVLALSCCRNAVIVGDLKQLSHIVEPRLKKKVQQLSQSLSISDVFNYNYQCILSSIVLLFKEINNKTLLKEHYRCHPQIIQYCNDKYYGGELIVFTKEECDNPPLILYQTTPGNHMRTFTNVKKGKFNMREIEVLMLEVLKSGKVPSDKEEILGFISPYRKQIEKAKETLSLTIEKDTVHKYQGRGKEVIIFSTVLDKSIDGRNDISFVDDPQLVNVAVSRAKNQFVLITSGELFKKHGTNIGDLIRYIEYNANEENVVQSDVISIFDLLYNEYSSKLIEVKAKIKNISQYQSECLINYVIEKVLEEDKYSCFNHVHSVKLSLLIRNMDKLNNDEQRYASNDLTCADFVIFNRFDKKPVLVIEVDGFAFHDNNPPQLIRDRMKDTILQKYGIPVLRIKSYESQEEDKIKNILDKIIQTGR